MSEYGSNNRSSDQQILQNAWLKYWAENGDSIVLSAWISKYGDYIDYEQNILESKITKDNSFQKECKLENTSKISNTQTYESEVQLESKSFSDEWQFIWEKHYEEQYNIKYSEFISTNEEKNIKNKKSCAYMKSKIYLNLNSDNEEYNYICEDNSKILSILDLPNAFGSTKKNSCKKWDNLYHQPSKSEDNIEESFYASSENPFINMDVQGLVIDKHEEKLTKKKLKRMKNKGVPQEILNNKILYKYWNKRFSLFSRFNLGIKLDEESWFSVTPEKVAMNIAQRFNKCNVIIDAFCGCGGNAIQFALICNHVIAIDIDPIKVELAKHNAKVYNVNHKIDFIVGDFLTLFENFQNLRIGGLFLSPPWGGPKYLSKPEYNIETDLKPVPASQLIKKCKTVTENIAIYLPKNSNKTQIVQLADLGKSIEIVSNYLNNKMIAVTAFYGKLIQDNENK